MVVKKRFKAFNDELLEHYPELQESLKPNDQYPELKHIFKFRPANLPVGSLNTKVIINEGEIIERVYQTPNGKVISLLSNSSDIFRDQAA